jgi:hypothetical protein
MNVFVKGFFRLRPERANLQMNGDPPELLPSNHLIKY